MINRIETLINFKQVINGGAKGVMCSYNMVNGVPACADDFLIKQVLRN